MSTADFAALRRQPPAKLLAALVGRIERGYRAGLAVEGFDDAVVVATLNSASQSVNPKRSALGCASFVRGSRIEKPTAVGPHRHRRLGANWQKNDLTHRATDNSP